MKTKEEVLKKLNDFNDKINYELSMLGWDMLFGGNRIHDDFTEFTLTVDTYFYQPYKVLLVSQNSEYDFKANSSFGIVWLDIIEVDTISKRDLEEMKMVFDKVEENLLKIGIPFDSSYKFNQKWKYRKNKQNRAKYDLDNLEKELIEVLQNDN